MKKVHWVLWAAALLNFSQAHAANTPNFSLNCKQGDARFAVAFQSASGEAAEDDMSISLVKDQASVKLPIEQGWFHAVAQQSKMPAACTLKSANEGAYPAFIHGSTLALFVVRDGRPGYPRLELALIELSSLKLIDFQSLGEMKTAFPVIQPDGEGYKVRVVRETNAAHCDCAEAYGDDWKTIAIKNTKIETQWLRN